MIHFLQPWMLLFAVAAVIPVLIQIWSRKRYAEVSWAATQFLAEALQKVSRQLAIQQLLLVILRSVLFVLLALALAGPYLGGDKQRQSAAGESSRLHFLLLDTSLSMQARDGELAAFDRARQAAAEVVRNANEGDGFVLLLFDGQVTPRIADPMADRQKILEELELAAATARGTRIRRVLQDLKQTSAWQGNFEFDQRHIHWFSDFAGEGWNFDAGVENTWNELQENASFIQHIVAPESLPNLSVKTLNPQSSKPVLGKPCRFQTEIRYDGGSEPMTLLVELLANQEVVGSRTVTVPPGETVTVPFEVTFSQAGEYRMTARIPADPLLPDNERFAVVEVRDRYRVLIVEGTAQSSRFLRIALDPTNLNPANLSSSVSRPFEVRVISPRELPDEKLAAHDVVMIDNCGSLTDADVVRLRQYANAGNPLLIFLGDQINVGQFNRQWSTGKAGGLPGLPTRLTQIFPAKLRSVDTRNYQSPILLDFRGNPQAGLDSLPIWTFVGTEIVNVDRVRIDLAFDTGEPLLATCRLGGGQALLWTTSSSSESRDRVQPDVSWNALETSPAFPALIQEMTRFVLAKPTTEPSVVGRTITGSLELESSVLQARVRSSSEDASEIRFRQKNSVVSWEARAPSVPGFFQIEFVTSGAKIVQTRVANIPAGESRLQRIAGWQNTDLEDSLSDFASSQDRSGVGFQWILLILAVLLGCETILSHWYGRAK